MSVARVVEAVAAVPDPELPFVTISDLGILRSVEVEEGRVRVCVTPTYSGCPALETIADDVRAVLQEQGYDEVEVETVLSPAWTTDWLSERGREALRAHGIAPPPGPRAGGPVPLGLPSVVPPTGSPAAATPPPPRAMPDQVWPYRIRHDPQETTVHPEDAGVACPQCGSADTEELARFGATACKALWRCRSCREPFEHLKAH